MIACVRLLTGRIRGKTESTLFSLLCKECHLSFLPFPFANSRVPNGAPSFPGKGQPPQWPQAQLSPGQRKWFYSSQRETSKDSSLKIRGEKPVMCEHSPCFLIILWLLGRKTCFEGNWIYFVHIQSYIYERISRLGKSPSKRREENHLIILALQPNYYLLKKYRQIHYTQLLLSRLCCFLSCLFH